MNATPDTIDWTHVAPQYKWMARDADGDVYLFDEKPEIPDEWDFWSGDIYTGADVIASYRRGTCDWRDSLVQRPEGV